MIGTKLRQPKEKSNAIEKYPPMLGTGLMRLKSIVTSNKSCEYVPLMMKSLTFPDNILYSDYGKEKRNR